MTAGDSTTIVLNIRTGKNALHVLCCDGAIFRHSILKAIYDVMQVIYDE
jgi:hypothetical protein